MICGIGTDIIEIHRIEELIQRHGEKFLQRTFTELERDYCDSFANSAEHYAVRFAAKEAVLKALGRGLREGMTWLDIEVSRDELGKPLIGLNGKAASLAQGGEFLISLSHNKTTALAMVVWQKEN